MPQKRPAAIDQFAAQLKGDRSSLWVFSRRAGRTGALNLALSGADGTLLGLLGIGLPDIPLFTGVLLKSLYQMAARYGCGWDTPAERYYLLLLIQGALSYGEELTACTALLDGFALAPCPPEDYDQEPGCLPPGQPPAGDEICPGHPHPGRGRGHLRRPLSGAGPTLRRAELPSTAFFWTTGPGPGLPRRAGACPRQNGSGQNQWLTGKRKCGRFSLVSNR